jgi:hypothetical protein
VRRLAAILGLLLVMSIAAPAAVAAPTGHAGMWQGIDCAQWSSNEPTDVDCNIWGDGGTVKMMISAGSSPAIIHVDMYSQECVALGTSAVFTAHGYGTYTDPGQMDTDFYGGGCGSHRVGPFGMGSLYWDPGSDTLWHDPDGDGYGVHYWRVGP